MIKNQNLGQKMVGPLTSMTLLTKQALSHDSYILINYLFHSIFKIPKVKIKNLLDKKIFVKNTYFTKKRNFLCRNWVEKSIRKILCRTWLKKSTPKFLCRNWLEKLTGKFLCRNLLEKL